MKYIYSLFLFFFINSSQSENFTKNFQDWYSYISVDLFTDKVSFNLITTAKDEGGRFEEGQIAIGLNRPSTSMNSLGIVFKYAMMADPDNKSSNGMIKMPAMFRIDKNDPIESYFLTTNSYAEGGIILSNYQDKEKFEKIMSEMLKGNEMILKISGYDTESVIYKFSLKGLNDALNYTVSQYNSH